jgi:hypothetical protein
MDAEMCDKRDTQKKRFIEGLTKQGAVYHAARAAGISRWTAYRWRQDDPEFASLWDEAIENAVDAVESVLYQKALGGDIVAVIFYLKAHRPIYRDRLNIDLKQVQSEIQEAIAHLRANPDLLAQSKVPGERLALKE